MMLRGSKGSSSSSSTPTESPNSLRSIAYARVLDALCEGPIFGLVDGLKSIYLNDTPIENADGSSNFSNYTVDWRNGTQDQTYLPGFPAVENEVGISVALRYDTPWTRAIENTQLTAVRIRLAVAALTNTNTSTGDITGAEVDYAIDLSTDGGAFATVLSASFNGKTTSTYERTHRIELGSAVSGWQVRVRRLTPDSTSAYLVNATTIEAITEVIDRKLRYPMTALVGMTFDASAFSSVPPRAYDTKMRIVQVPSNYDPDTRAYTGAWDGTFKSAWSDNPAWGYRDLLLDDRYGLGKRVDASMIDIWTLYNIAQYCDVMVSDGKGGTEPRFTANFYLQSRADAYKVLQDIASIFRGISFYGSAMVSAGCDMPSDPVYVYTKANVEGEFDYVGSSRKSRYTTCLVTWNDPSDGYAQVPEYVQDPDGIARYGVNKTEITAFGTTSQGQAHRLGLWTLLTSRYETNSVSFTVGMDGVLCAPGQVIAVADPDKAGRRIGGRVKAVDGRVLTLDKAPTAAAGDKLTCVLPTGVAQARTLSAADGDTLTVTEAFDADPVPGAVWMLESADLAAQTFRVVSVKQNDDDDAITFTVNATQYEPGKFDAIDNGAAITVRPSTVIPAYAQAAPSSVTVSSYSAIDQGISKTTMVISWPKTDGATSYIAGWQKDSGEWVAMNETGSLSVEVPGIYAGKYLARVYAKNALGVISIATYSDLTTLTGKTGLPPSLVSLTTDAQVFGIGLSWGFPGDGTAGDTQRTEVWYSRTNDRTAATKVSDYAYPQADADLLGLAAGQSFFFWGRLVDTTGNIGPWYPVSATGGVLGQSSTDATPILQYIAGKISKTELALDVLDPINLIPGLQSGVSDNAGAIAQEINDRANAITQEAAARAQAIADEAAARGAAVTSEQTARQDADTSLGDRIDTVTAASGGNTAAIQQEVTARTDGDTALGQRLDTLTTTVAGNTASITDEATTRASADTALGDRITTMQASVDGAHSDIASEASTRATADTALSDRIDSVTATLSIIDPPMAGDDETYAGSEEIYAGVYSEQSARAEADLALAQDIKTVSASITKNNDTLTALVQTETNARVTADQATADQITTVQAQVNDNSAAVQTVASSYADLSGKVNASYTIRVQATANGRTALAGIGLGVDNSTGLVESQVLVTADRFAVISSDGTSVTAPFVIQGGQTLINSAIIGTGMITSAMIGDYIQSNNYVAGTQGWRLDKAGTFENNGTGGGGRTTLNSNGFYVYDPNGVARTEIGFLA